MEIKNNMQTVKTRKKKILKRKISRKKSSKYGGNLVNKNLSIRMDTKNVQSIKSFFEPLQFYFKSPVDIIFTSSNIQNAYINNLNSTKAINTVSKYLYINRKDKYNKQILIKLLNDNIDIDKVKVFQLNFPLDNSNVHILINLLYLSIKNIIQKLKKNRYSKSKSNLIRLSKEKKSVQKLLYETNKNNIFEYLSEYQRQELILMIREQMINRIDNYYNIYNLFKIFFKNDKVPLRGEIITSNNYKKQIFEICKRDLSTINLKSGTLNIPIQKMEDYEEESKLILNDIPVEENSVDIEASEVKEAPMVRNEVKRQIAGAETPPGFISASIDMVGGAVNHCPICLEEFSESEKDGIKTIQCNICYQKFHHNCIRVWCKTKGTQMTCPNCRDPDICKNNDLSVPESLLISRKVLSSAFFKHYLPTSEIRDHSRYDINLTEEMIDKIDLQLVDSDVYQFRELVLEILSKSITNISEYTTAVLDDEKNFFIIDGEKKFIIKDWMKEDFIRNKIYENAITFQQEVSGNSEWFTTLRSEDSSDIKFFYDMHQLMMTMDTQFHILAEWEEEESSRWQRIISREHRDLYNKYERIRLRLVDLKKDIFTLGVIFIKREQEF